MTWSTELYCFLHQGLEMFGVKQMLLGKASFNLTVISQDHWSFPKKTVKTAGELRSRRFYIFLVFIYHSREQIQNSQLNGWNNLNHLHVAMYIKSFKFSHNIFFPMGSVLFYKTLCFVGAWHALPFLTKTFPSHHLSSHIPLSSLLFHSVKSLFKRCKRV